MDLYRLVVIIGVIILPVSVSAQQTPVENIIIRYEDVSGARSFVAQGFRMKLARALIERTNLASIAQDVDELAVLRMEDAAPEARLHFVAELNEVLKGYDYYGRHPSKNGEVDVYVQHPQSGLVKELVIYNSDIYSLTSLHGTFTVAELQKLDNAD